MGMHILQVKRTSDCWTRIRSSWLAGMVWFEFEPRERAHLTGIFRLRGDDPESLPSELLLFAVTALLEVNAGTIRDYSAVPLSVWGRYESLPSFDNREEIDKRR